MKRTVLILAIVTLVVAVLRFFMKGLLEPIGVPPVLGSFVASVTVVLLVSVFLLFGKEGHRTDGSYLRAAGWYVALAVWAEILVIGGIIATEEMGVSTYFEGPWEMVQEMFPNPMAHAIGHTQGFFPRTAIALILGGIVYAVARRRQRAYGIAGN